MKFLSRFIASVLSLAIVASAGAFIASAIAWNPTRLQEAAHSTNVSAQFATAIPTILNTSLTLTPDEQFIVKTVVTPKRIEPLVDQIFGNIAAADGTPLNLDLSSFQQAVSTEGLPLPADLQKLTEKPVKLISADKAVKLASFKQTNDKIKIFAPIISVVLIMLIIILAKRQRFLVLGEASLFAAIELALLGLLAPKLPDLATSAIATSDFAPLKGAYLALTSSLTNLAKHDFLLAAEIVGGVSLLMFIVHGFLRVSGKLSKKH
ncbi:MAG: hypothetical protein ABIS59_02070 [Candidatus Saccharibacteria bacterium]